MDNNKVSKQHRVPYIGAFLHITYQTMPIYSLVGQVSSLIAAYGIWRTSLLAKAPWLTLPVFFGLLIIFAVVALVVNYKFFYLSYFEFQNKQQFVNNSQLKEVIREVIREELDKRC